MSNRFRLMVNNSICKDASCLQNMTVMSNRKPLARSSIITGLVLSFISGIFLFGGLMAVLTVLPFPTDGLTTFPGTILLFFLTVGFSFVLYQLLPPEDASGESFSEF
ncbi:MAG: hypothetical protein ACE5OZ_23755 [Candidatus Heimdallarchaeota archaeon]